MQKPQLHYYDLDVNVVAFSSTRHGGYSTGSHGEFNINEHCGDNVIYIVDPAELYVRFAMQPTLEVDRSSGFLSATTAMRCLAVVDYAWNPAACIKVSKKAA